jgi:hypothetical protein
MSKRYTKAEQTAHLRKLRDELASGKWKKCEGRMRDGEARCVSGVAYELLMNDLGLTWVGDDPGSRALPEELFTDPPVNYYGDNEYPDKGWEIIEVNNAHPGDWEPVIAVIDDVIADREAKGYVEERA